MKSISLQWKISLLKRQIPTVTGDELTNAAYDFFEQMQYLYVRVVMANDFYIMDATGGCESCDPYVEVKLGNCKGTIQQFEENLNPV